MLSLRVQISGKKVTWKMAFNELEEFSEHYIAYREKISALRDYGDLVSKARDEMFSVKGEDKFFFTPRFLPEKIIAEHRVRCEKTIEVVNRILKENREGEHTPLSDIIPRKRQYNVPMKGMYEKAIELVDPKFPSIMESRIDGCISDGGSMTAYEINANRAGWENSRMFCSIYEKYFGNLLVGKTIDFADGWEDLIRYMLKKIGGKKALYLTEQTGKESIDELKRRGIDIDFVRFQDLHSLMKSGELSISKDEVVYKKERVDLICRFLRTHQVFEVPELCECVKAGNVHLINQMDAFFGGIKTLMIRLADRDIMSPYADVDDLIRLPESSFLSDKENKELISRKQDYVLKFANRGGGKAVHFGMDMRNKEWGGMLESSRLRFSETAMVQKYVEPSVSPVFDLGATSLMNTTCDVFVFVAGNPKSAGVFSRCSCENLVNFKTGGIKQTVFV
jgi:hypothetical protein